MADSKSTPIHHLPKNENVQMQMTQQTNQPSPPMQNPQVYNNPRGMVYDNQSMGSQPDTPHPPVMNQQQNYQYQPQYNDNPVLNNEIDDKTRTIFQLMLSQSKMLSIIFLLLFMVQLNATQGLVSKLTKLLNIPDNMASVSGKLIASLVGVILFFFVFKNL